MSVGGPQGASWGPPSDGGPLNKKGYAHMSLRVSQETVSAQISNIMKEKGGPQEGYKGPLLSCRGPRGAP